MSIQWRLMIIQYPEKLHEFHNDLPLCLKEWKFKSLRNSILHDKKQFAVHIRHLKQVLNHGLVLKKVQRIIKINQKA